MTDILARVEAVLAAERRRFRGARATDTDMFRYATYPEALAVVRAVRVEHLGGHYAMSYAECSFPMCQALAAYLAKAQEYVDAG